jgi:hypothetical protein
LRRNCLPKGVIERKVEGRTEGTRRRGKIFMHLLNHLEEKRRYYRLKEEALEGLFGELALEEAMGLSQDRARNELTR